MAGPMMEVEERKKTLMPSIRREQPELHSPIDALSRGAEHIRVIPGTHHDVQQAERILRIRANVEQFLREGTTPLHTRFARLLESL